MQITTRNNHNRNKLIQKWHKGNMTNHQKRDTMTELKRTVQKTNR